MQKITLSLAESLTTKIEGSPHGVVANVLDNEIAVTEFELQLRNYVHFGLMP